MPEHFETKCCIKALYKYSSFPFLSSASAVSIPVANLTTFGVQIHVPIMLRCIYITSYMLIRLLNNVSDADEHSVLQAIEFDVEHKYKSRLEVSLQRLQLRTQLYTKPDRNEDAAALIIEQVTLRLLT